MIPSAVIFAIYPKYHFCPKPSSCPQMDRPTSSSKSLRELWLYFMVFLIVPLAPPLARGSQSFYQRTLLNTGLPYSCCSPSETPDGPCNAGHHHAALCLTTLLLYSLQQALPASSHKRLSFKLFHRLARINLHWCSLCTLSARTVKFTLAKIAAFVPVGLQTPVLRPPSPSPHSPHPGLNCSRWRAMKTQGLIQSYRKEDSKERFVK